MIFISNYDFLAYQYPNIYEHASKLDETISTDPMSNIAGLREVLFLMVDKIAEEAGVNQRRSLMRKLMDLKEEEIIPVDIYQLLQETRMIIDKLIHDEMDEELLVAANEKIYKVAQWFYENYAHDEIAEKLEVIETEELDTLNQVKYVRDVLSEIIDEIAERENIQLEEGMFEKISILKENKAISEEIFRLMHETRSIYNIIIHSGMDEEKIEVANKNIEDIAEWFYNKYSPNTVEVVEEEVHVVEEVGEEVVEVSDDPSELEQIIDEIISIEGLNEDGQLTEKINDLKENNIISHDVFKLMYDIRKLYDEGDSTGEFDQAMGELNSWFEESYGGMVEVSAENYDFLEKRAPVLYGYGTIAMENIEANPELAAIALIKVLEKTVENTAKSLDVDISDCDTLLASINEISEYLSDEVVSGFDNSRRLRNILVNNRVTIPRVIELNDSLLDLLVKLYS